MFLYISYPPIGPVRDAIFPIGPVRVGGMDEAAKFNSKAKYWKLNPQSWYIEHVSTTRLTLCGGRGGSDPIRSQDLIRSTQAEIQTIRSDPDRDP